MAEKRFSHQILESPDAFRAQYVDVLLPLPGFALSAAGAGFINVETDRDGIRRRIDLAQNIHGYWYLQLALSPLVDYLGNPVIELDSRRMYLRKAKMPNSITKDIKIPLDGKGRMLLDWPKTDYADSYSHISFADFSVLEELEIELEQYAQALADTDITFFADQDISLARIPLIVKDIVIFLDNIHANRADALDNCSDEAFRNYMDCRKISHGLLREILSLDPEIKVNDLIPELDELYPNNAGAIREKAEYISTLAESLRINLDRYESLGEKIEEMVKNKFCILGRVDSRTPDTGSNPFFSGYANAGTHGVVLDMILSGSFITYAGIYWQIFFALVFVTLFLLASSRLSLVLRVFSGFIITALVIALTVLLFRFTGLFFSPLITVFSMASTVIIEVGTRVWGQKIVTPHDLISNS
jgi:adenylate cyclase